MESAEIDLWLEQNRGQARTGGITAVDLLDLPDALGHLLRVIIAGGPMTMAEVRQAIATSPESAPWGEEALRYAVTALCDQMWLRRDDVSADAGDVGPRYSVNFRTTSRTPNTKRSRPILDFDL